MDGAHHKPHRGPAQRTERPDRSRSAIARPPTSQFQSPPRRRRRGLLDWPSVPSSADRADPKVSARRSAVGVAMGLPGHAHLRRPFAGAGRSVPRTSVWHANRSPSSIGAAWYRTSSGSSFSPQARGGVFDRTHLTSRVARWGLDEDQRSRADRWLACARRGRSLRALDAVNICIEEAHGCKQESSGLRRNLWVGTARNLSCGICRAGSQPLENRVSHRSHSSGGGCLVQHRNEYENVCLTSGEQGVESQPLAQRCPLGSAHGFC